MTIATAIAILIIAVMVWAMIKQYETKVVLIAGAIAMAVTAGQPGLLLASFSKSMKMTNVFEIIITSMAFAAVVKLTGCDRHLVAVFVKILKKSGPFLMVGVALTTMVVNISIPSAAGTSATVGIVLIPLLISAGVPAPLAAGTILCGLYGGNLNPGHVHPTIVADIAQKTGMDFVSLVSLPLIGSVVVSSSILMLVTLWMRKKRPNAFAEYTGDLSEVEAIQNMKINYLFVPIPLLPLILLMLGNTYVPFLKMPVSHAMIIGSFVAMAATLKSPIEISKAFFKGMGTSFGDIFGLIVCTTIFVETMQAVGLIKQLVDTMIATPAIAKVSAIFGPFLVTLLSGSGEAVSIALNKAVTVHANQFGMEILNMGAMVVLSGGIGRSATILSACTIVCAGIAKVSPIQIIKYNWFAMVAALLFCAVTLDF
ncbi:MAG: C4-dicarboxylate transporter DcuC [Deltaproteobacteria bacterium]|jgi:DcuC family C4-dicarboxylate transporter|nr:C4-dicarboxylate transporter DcuC [Deltaproteobacteria bacterium]